MFTCISTSAPGFTRLQDKLNAASQFNRLLCKRNILPRYNTVVNGEWWIGWVQDVYGVTCQERTREELLETLRIHCVKS